MTFIQLPDTTFTIIQILRIRRLYIIGSWLVYDDLTDVINNVIANG